MPNIMEFSWLYEGFVYLFLGIITLIISKFIINFLTPYKIDKELIHSDNSALGLTLAGYYLGVIVIYLGAVIGETDYGGVWSEILTQCSIDFAYALFGILTLNLCRVIVDKTILYKFSTTKEIITDHNLGTAAVECGSMIATAFMIAGAIHGEGGFLSALVFFILGQLLLIVFALFHQLITPYDVHDEIEKDNVAAGAYMGFDMVALGIITLHATMGDFVSWSHNLRYFAAYALLGILALTVFQKIATGFFLAGAPLEEEITRDRNMNIAWISGSISIGISSMIFFLL
ncbi:MAG: DUF350 domain-containing protein [Desulfobulbaceae bacterium]|nr:DUF350 domain-containing protein [Desulfobulbaceae bacterium]